VASKKRRKVIDRAIREKERIDRLARRRKMRLEQKRLAEKEQEINDPVEA